jgi:hypothetical protein
MGRMSRVFKVWAHGMVQRTLDRGSFQPLYMISA